MPHIIDQQGHTISNDRFGLEGNPWAFFLDEDFNRAFDAFRPRQGSQNFLDYTLGRGRTDALTAFNSANAQLALAGQAPNLEPTSFLQDFDFMDRFRNLPREDRGEDDRRFRPITRFGLSGR